MENENREYILRVYSYQKSVPKWRVAVRLLGIGISLPRKILVI